ncbi:ExeM/NucH family extracellular endonuclease [Alteromonas pelagimontana]|uniref:ExeM/NucH family extracellular endonuclease n=1 Tax=Alteromonas pelagimontana TaxID=1858656 RepID=A0A6M4MDV4_9ALTE|nr:ExeM/NucH family extracellular endonuclease [Alteromonas pelagimontana]QJR80326.1 ExeM/NucH family extracellular endonuclease [Alteromonas pelagimontana]
MKATVLLPLVLSVSTTALANDVFISQYIEGSSNNKAIELYNPTDASISLTGYNLSFYSNGNTSASTIIDLGDTIEAGATFVIADSSASSEILALANVTSGQSFFNGDDAVVLAKSGNVVDSIGQVGVDPGSQWGSGDTSTQNNTLIRLASVSVGDTDPSDVFDPAIGWSGLPQDDLTDLGSHTYDGSDDSGDGGDEDEDLSNVCTNCPDLDKIADASTFNPAVYYAAVQTEINNGSSTDVVRQILSETIASGQRTLTYSEVWTALTETDEDPTNPENVRLFYSNRSIAKSSNGSGAASNNPDNWNREHSWPKSHGFPNSGQEAYTDIQHLRATDISVNSSRGNLDFDNSDSPLGEAPENRVDGDSFEPRDAIKGDVARMMLYMDIRYEGNGSDSTPDLTLVNRITSGSEASLGKLCTLLQWNEADTVDAEEQRRQNAIYEYQGNRNPFVDHPEWVDMFYSAATCDEEPVDPIDPEEPELPAPSTGVAPVIITGVFDGPLTGGVPKGIELYVTQDIADLSVCGVGSANNGGGSDGEEFTFPVVSASAGDFIYVASESEGFAAFMGFAPDYTTGAMAINGDDAVEVFCNGEVVDLFGDVDTDGNGEAWEYLDSWAYRTAGAGSATFDVSQWLFAGANEWDGESSNSTAASPFPLATYLPPATELFFSEYIEGSGNNKALEIANLGFSDVDLNGYDVQVYANGATTANSTIALTGTLAAGDVFVIANSSAGSAIMAQADLVSGGLSFNGDDAVTLRLDGEIIDSIGQIGFRPNSAWGSGDTSTLNSTLRRKSSVRSGDSNALDEFVPASQWDGFPIDTFDGLGSYTQVEAPFELGFCGEPATYISAIQGEGATSALSGETVVVEAAVSHVTPNLGGFFIQEETVDYDNNANTSEGIFVAAPALLGTVAVGDVVRVGGIIGETYGRTEIAAQSEALVCGTYTVTPVAISLPKAEADSFEAVEGMLVSSNQSWVISDNYNYTAYGEVVVSTERLFTPSQVALPGSEAFAAVERQNELDHLLIDDNSDGADTTELLLSPGGFSPYNPVRAGDTVTGVTGVMDYGFSEYRIRPVETISVANTNPREDEPVLADGNLKVASFNVLNLFNGDGQGEGFPTSRGADTYEEYLRQRTKIVNAIVELDADVIGLLELENDGFSERSTIAQLVDDINANLGVNAYAFVDVGTSEVGTDEITSGMIYRPAVVELSGSAQVLLETNSIVDENGPLWGTAKNRPSIAQAFVHSETGQTFVVDVNHLKSKGSSCGSGDDSAEQGSCNLTRTRAAMALHAWLAQTFPDTATIIMGDLNAYGKEDPIQYLVTSGYTNTVAALKGEKSYSYTFDGLAGTLDYQLINAPMQEWLVDVTEWHINADEATALDYNEENKPQSYLNELLFRASDHDPVIASYLLESADVTGDWDGDGDVDIDDIRAFFSALLSKQKIGMEFDLNQDGKVDTQDMTKMRTMCTYYACRTEEVSPTKTGSSANVSRLSR